MSNFTLAIKQRHSLIHLSKKLRKYWHMGRKVIQIFHAPVYLSMKMPMNSRDVLSHIRMHVSLFAKKCRIYQHANFSICFRFFIKHSINRWHYLPLILLCAYVMIFLEKRVPCLWVKGTMYVEWISLKYMEFNSQFLQNLNI